MCYSTFIVNLRMLIESRGLTLRDFCADVGIPASTVSRYLNEDREPKFSNVIKIAEYFNVSIDWLVGVTGKRIDVLPEDIQDVVFLYSLASDDDRRVIRTLLSKYEKE